MLRPLSNAPGGNSSVSGYSPSRDKLAKDCLRLIIRIISEGPSQLSFSLSTAAPMPLGMEHWLAIYAIRKISTALYATTALGGTNQIINADQNQLDAFDKVQAILHLEHCACMLPCLESLGRVDHLSWIDAYGQLVSRIHCTFADGSFTFEAIFAYSKTASTCMRLLQSCIATFDVCGMSAVPLELLLGGILLPHGQLYQTTTAAAKLLLSPSPWLDVYEALPSECAENKAGGPFPIVNALVQEIVKLANVPGASSATSLTVVA